MSSVIRTRVTIIWLILIVATGLSWLLFHSMQSYDVRWSGVGIICIAFVKVRFVVLDFMEIRHAPIVMRVIAESWVLLICATLLILYLQSVGSQCM